MLILFLLLILFSCNVNKRFYKDGSEWIPANFDQSKDILLVEIYPANEKWNISMVDFINKHYSGKYQLADKNIIFSDSKYSRKVYKYAVLWRIHGGSANSVHTSFSPNLTINSYSSDASENWTGHFYDRSTGKEYPETRKYNNYGLKGYIPFFNSVAKYSKR